LTLNAAEARNRHTPISELLALSDTRFLVLERDSRGRGGDPGPILYKKIIVADVSNASNILGTGYDLEKGAPGQLSLPRSGLPSNIVAAARRDLRMLRECVIETHRVRTRERDHLLDAACYARG